MNFFSKAKFLILCLIINCSCTSKKNLAVHFKLLDVNTKEPVSDAHIRACPIYLFAPANILPKILTSKNPSPTLAFFTTNSVTTKTNHYGEAIIKLRSNTPYDISINSKEYPPIICTIKNINNINASNIEINKKYKNKIELQINTEHQK